MKVKKVRVKLNVIEKEKRLMEDTLRKYKNYFSGCKVLGRFKHELGSGTVVVVEVYDLGDPNNVGVIDNFGDCQLWPMEWFIKKKDKIIKGPFKLNFSKELIKTLKKTFEEDAVQIRPRPVRRRKRVQLKI